MAALNYFVIDRMETGNRICAYRKGMHLSREGLADILSEMDVWVSINSIGKWERGEVDISFDYAHALSKVFGCKLYGELVVFHLREIDDEHDQPAPNLTIISYRLSVRQMYAFCVHLSFCFINR